MFSTLSWVDAGGISPGSINAHYNLGLAYVQLEEHEAALNEYRMLQSLDATRAEKLQQAILTAQAKSKVRKGAKR